MRTTYFLSRETVIASKLEGMARWRSAVCVHVEECYNGNLRCLQSAAQPSD
jgi:KUP system potassium uptake protein